MKSFLIVLASLVVLSSVQAGPPRRYRNSYQPQQFSQPTGSYVVSGSSAPGNMVPPAPPITVTGDGADALAEVNAARAQRGLKPYINDPVLNKAAQKCAARRASILCAGHCPESDFTYLDPVYPVSSVVGGCAAWEPSWGWGACATYDNYTYCGAAWVMGRDGKRYMHLFVR